MTNKNKGYNGWTNYETWAVKLWMDNDQGLYNMFREWTAESETYELSERIKDFFEEENPLNEMPSGVYHDLLNAALSEVNWYEIAENLKEDN